MPEETGLNPSSEPGFSFQATTQSDPDSARTGHAQNRPFNVSVRAIPSSSKPDARVQLLISTQTAGTHGQGSPILNAVERERIARSIWQANRTAMDTPHWFGFPEEDQAQEEAELPQQFGIALNGGRIAADGVAAPGRAAPGRNDGLLSFPLQCHELDARSLPRRSPEILPFRAPAGKKAIAIFSLVGGVGGTSLAAALTRLLAQCGERVMLADTDGHSLLPAYFGGKGSRQGAVRRFVPLPGSKSDAISMVSLDVDSFAGSDEEMDRILQEFRDAAARVDRVVWDLGSAPADWIDKVLHQDVLVIVPLLPAAKCLMQLPATERALQRGGRQSRPARWQYILNQFDERDPAHVDMRRRLRMQLGDRLLPFTLRSSPLVNEALLSGRTVVDHAPASPLVSDLMRLARSIAGIAQLAPALSPEAWGES